MRNYKEDLKQWYSKSLFKIPYEDDREYSFNDLDISMKFGVEQSFLQARGITADVVGMGSDESIGKSFGMFIDKEYLGEYSTRKSAMEGILTRAIGIYESE
jgi:hypothetical protein